MSNSTGLRAIESGAGDVTQWLQVTGLSIEQP